MSQCDRVTEVKLLHFLTKQALASTRESLGREIFYYTIFQDNFILVAPSKSQ
jgi:hypothetical protein